MADWKSPRRIALLPGYGYIFAQRDPEKGERVCLETRDGDVQGEVVDANAGSPGSVRIHWQDKAEADPPEPFISWRRE